MRDDFKKATKETLAKRVNFLCSNPDCRKPTIGPHTENSRWSNIGVAAHIKAASPLGPRYDKSMTITERSHRNNGIWLCENCAKLIDSDESKYSSELLLSWKSETEKYIANQLINSKNDIINNELGFSIIRMTPKNIWIEYDSEDQKYSLFQNVGIKCYKYFKLNKWVVSDPTFDIILLNKKKTPVIIDSIGVQFLGIACYPIGGPEVPPYYEIKKAKSYQLDCSSVLGSLIKYQVHYDDIIDIIRNKQYDEIINENYYKFSIDNVINYFGGDGEGALFLNDSKEKYSHYLDNPLILNSLKPYRFNLQLKKTNNFHELIVRIFISSDNGKLFSHMLNISNIG